MSESVIADFVGEFVTDQSTSEEPIRGRILLSQKRLVLASEEGKVQIPLASIFDIAVGEVPADLAEFFGSTVTIGFERGGGRHTAIIEADTETVGRFRDVLFKAVLNGTKVTVKHPARIGGRVTDADPREAALRISPGTVEFAGPDFEIDLATVTDFEYRRRTVDGETQSVLSVAHRPEGRALVSEVAVPSEPKMNVLGRYLRLEYGEMLAEADDVDLSEEELEALVALYSAPDGVDLSEVVDADPSRLAMILNSLREAGLVVEGEESAALTQQGQILVNDRVETVNR